MAQARARLAALGAGEWAEALLVLEVAGESVGLGSTEFYSCKGIELVTYIQINRYRRYIRYV